MNVEVRLSSLAKSDLSKFLLAWAGFLGLVVTCFGFTGRITGQGFLAGARAAAGAILVAGSFVTALAYLGHLIDRRFDFDAVFRCIGGILGLVCASLLGIYLYGHIPPAGGP